MSNRPMQEIITRRHPVTLPPEATVQEACQAMRQHGIGAILVTDPEGRLLGIFTGRDAVCRMLAEGRDPRATRLGEVMTAKPDCMPPRMRAIEALRLMRDGGFRHVPVVEGERLVGVVSRGDFQGSEQSRLEEESCLWERL
ncbi:CBS domain-containing protein [Roseicella aquatilis]|uniref:CBS domain-containing protein n=1 Tax=Roseicella aquatilis TaxID=2527868 RepID=A0A4R4DWX6_9PROT|nr:CBS domain-containing protein [Roseicella aquatilis]TCZ65373.1 CBS domain-containing protein [Roseicella aquatilis]